MLRLHFTRRSFLGCVPGLLAGAYVPPAAARTDAPEVTDPRATDGDERHEPEWDERLTITVGQANADLVGNSDKAVQAAVDYVRRGGGGTVRILPGTYVFRNAVQLPSGIRLCGSGADTILTKIPSETVKLAADSDWYDQEITLSAAGAFRVGDGIALRATDPQDGGSTVIKRTLVARSGNRFKLDDGLRENLWLSGSPTCSSLFPLLASEHAADVTIENLTLDGNAGANENFNGNYGGCVFLQDCNRFTLRNVEARNYDGDGISFQVCHDVVVENCYCHDNTDLGVHPGSGSQRPVIRGCRLQRNSIGLFWCWGVKFGLAEDNRLEDNRRYGISIGHNDTDNVMRHNLISGSGQIGILFRDEPQGTDFWPNRNVLEANRVYDSGGPHGIAIDIQGRTKDVRIVGNDIRETRDPGQRTGIRIGAQAERIEMTDNQVNGFACAIADDRRPANG